MWRRMPLSSATPYVHQAVQRHQPRAFRAQSPGCSHQDARIIIFDRIRQKRMPLRPACHRPSRDFFCSTEQEELLVEATDPRLPAKPAGISPPPRTDPAATTFTSALSRQGSGWEPPDALDPIPACSPSPLTWKNVVQAARCKGLFVCPRDREKGSEDRFKFSGKSVGTGSQKETSRTDTNVAVPHLGTAWSGIWHRLFYLNFSKAKTPGGFAFDHQLCQWRANVGSQRLLTEPWWRDLREGKPREVVAEGQARMGNDDGG